MKSLCMGVLCALSGALARPPVAKHTANLLSFVALSGVLTHAAPPGIPPNNGGTNAGGDSSNWLRSGRKRDRQSSPPTATSEGSDGEAKSDSFLTDSAGIIAPARSRRRTGGSFLKGFSCACHNPFAGFALTSRSKTQRSLRGFSSVPAAMALDEVPVPPPSAPLTLVGKEVPDVKTQPQTRPPDGTFWMGPGTLKIDLSMHREHREKVCGVLQTGSWNGDGSKAEPTTAGTFMILEGGTENEKYDTDTNFNFRQESNFQYLFGVKEPGCYAAIDVATQKSYLFVPEFPPEYSVWMGTIKGLDWFKATYLVDEVHFVGQMAEVLSGAGASKLLWYKGNNRDSGNALPKPSFAGDDKFEYLDDQRMFFALQETRLTKSAKEMLIMDFACQVSSLAHIACMQASEPGQMEYITEATFKYHSHIRGCAHQGYDNICCGGLRNTWLHYGHPAEPNSELVPNNAMRLCDMGSEYHVYTSDVHTILRFLSKRQQIQSQHEFFFFKFNRNIFLIDV